MGRILIVAEKPSVANDIARVLGCTKKGEGFIESDRYIVSWALELQRYRLHNMCYGFGARG